MDLLVGHGVDTTALSSEYLRIPLTGDELEDLAPMIQDLQVTTSVESWLALDYLVILQRRGLNGHGRMFPAEPSSLLRRAREA